MRASYIKEGSVNYFHTKDHFVSNKYMIDLKG